MSITITKYNGRYWEELCRIHDAARKMELEYASLTDAFLLLEAVAEAEGLFAYKHIDVALQDGHAVGFLRLFRGRSGMAVHFAGKNAAGSRQTTDRPCVGY